MSRSRRKTPIFGITTCASERLDKKIWHGRWRSRERCRLETGQDDLTVLPKQVSNPWGMGKDGRRYWPAHERESHVEAVASRKGRTGREEESIKARLRRKWMAK